MTRRIRFSRRVNENFNDDLIDKDIARRELAKNPPVEAPARTVAPPAPKPAPTHRSRLVVFCLDCGSSSSLLGACAKCGSRRCTTERIEEPLTHVDAFVEGLALGQGIESTVRTLRIERMKEDDSHSHR